MSQTTNAPKGAAMVGKPGNRIIVESQRVGQLEREGEILEVMQTSVSVRYRVRWNDGHESTLTPAGGVARVVPSTGSSTAPGSGSRTGSAAKPKDRADKGGKASEGRAKQEGGKKDKKTKGSKKA
jgi:uncharacterized protein DUF1918